MRTEFDDRSEAEGDGPAQRERFNRVRTELTALGF